MAVTGVGRTPLEWKNRGGVKGKNSFLAGLGKRKTRGLTVSGEGNRVHTKKQSVCVRFAGGEGRKNLDPPGLGGRESTTRY